MYRRTKKYQLMIERRAVLRAEIEKQKLGINLADFPSELRRIIEITDLDSGSPITPRLELYRSNRIDCYIPK